MNPLLLGLLGKVIDGVSSFLDPSKKAEAQLAILKLQQEGEFKAIDDALARDTLAKDTIVAEATSTDKWTSRARPSFMYVIYILILSAIPMGILTAFEPATAHQITIGFGEWLKAIPSEMLALFGVGYVGYVGARSMEKIKGKE